MEKIKITGFDDVYQIQSIRQSAEHVLQIIFCDAIPASWDGNIQIYTAGGILATTLKMCIRDRLDINQANKTLKVDLMLDVIMKDTYIYNLMRAMAPADMIVTVSIVFNRNSCLLYTSTEDTNLNKYVNKKKSTGKVDMVVALINAIYLLQQDLLYGSDDFIVQVC